MAPRTPTYEYELVPKDQDEDLEDQSIKPSRPQKRLCARHPGYLMAFIFAFLLLIGLGYGLSTKYPLGGSYSTCDDTVRGYHCRPEISRYWGQYSPFFSVPSEISADVPDQCSIAFASVLSRHGARDPTEGKTKTYAALIMKIKSNVPKFTGPYEFLNKYSYTLGADQLTLFGQQELVNSGIRFYTRYRNLSSHAIPFVRASGEQRVIDSAVNFTKGYHMARQSSDTGIPDEYPYPILEVSEDEGMNNTLSHGLCDAFEDGPTSSIRSNAQAKWMSVFVPKIRDRLNDGMPSANLTDDDTIYFMDLCPFETVANPTGQISQFCDLFEEKEWKEYDYFQSLGKYYGYGDGNPLGPTQGVGYANELIARLTGKPVVDHTNVNHSLDDNPKTFPVGDDFRLFADFSHDNDMTSIYSALGLYNSTKPLSNTTIQDAQQTNGFSASWVVPFAAQAYFEKMTCGGSDEEFVRVLVNDRVIPLEFCGGDKLGRCTLSAFVEGLSFAREGGKWSEC